MEASMAPELGDGLAWINADHPVKLEELRGKVIVLHFWTYGSIHCQQVLPMLDALEARLPSALVVIGVHCARFPAEQQPARIREAVRRSGIRHPVHVDDDLHLWDRYGISSWPTLVIVRPNGRIAAIAPGEPDATLLDSFVDQVLADARADGSLKENAHPVAAAAATAPGQLAFPGQVLTAADGRVFIADSGHHRVLILTADGAVMDQIGSGERGQRAGSFADARFESPQGLALDGDSLYIADAGAHVIVHANLRERTVTPVAGSGRLGHGALSTDPSAASTDLRSPWGLALHERTLFFTAAGSNQLGAIDLRSGTMSRFAGTGRSAIVDGPSARAAFAQPSGLHLHGGTLFVADSEGSAIRAVELSTGTVRTVVGRGLFDFGNTDGPVETARLQHPMDVVWTPAGLVIADSYNDRLRLLDSDFKSVQSLSIIVDGLSLLEPAGLSIAPDGSLLIADTNRHRVVRLPVRDARVDPAVASTVYG